MSKDMPGGAAAHHAAVGLGTPAGARIVRVTVVLDLLASVAAAVFLVLLARLIAAEFSPSMLVTALIAAICWLLAAVVPQWLGTTSATTEEAPLRERLLRRWWCIASFGRRDEGSGARIALFTDSVERYTQFRQGFMGPQIAASISPLLVLAVIAIAIDPLTAVILAVMVPLVPWVVKRFSVLSRAAATESRQIRSKLANQYLESIQGLETLTIHHAAGRTAGQLAAAGEQNRRATMRVLARNQLVLFFSDAVFSLALVTLSAVLAAWRLETGAITPAGAIAVVLCSVLLLQPLDLMAGGFYVGMAGRAAQRAITGFLTGQKSAGHGRPAHGGVAGQQLTASSADVSPRTSRSQSPDPRSRTQSSCGPADASAIIEVRHATLGYPGTDVLQDCCFRLERGARAVIVGPSGAGKSTVLRALKGDVIPTRGQVTVAGIPLTAATQAQVRARSAMVTQSTWLFTGSIRRNLSLVKPDANDEQLWQALDLVDMHNFVEGLPAGIDTQVGERGQALSGGQAQRLSLARAFLSGRHLLLLDEPTSQVDLFSEQVIMRALDQLAADHTVVLVTHRMPAAADADQVWQAEAGRLRRTDRTEGRNV